MCACVLRVCLAEPKTQLLALIDFSDREDFPVQGHAPSNRLRSLLAGKGVPSPRLNGTFQPVCWRAGCEQGLGVQGKGLAAPARQSFTVEEPNCTRHLQTPRNWQLSTPFPRAGLEEYITCGEFMQEAQNKGFLKTSPEVWLWKQVFFPPGPLHPCLQPACLKVCYRTFNGEVPFQ